MSIAKQLLELINAKPKPGDRVRALPNSRYGITRDGWEGIVISGHLHKEDEADDLLVMGAGGHLYAGSSFTVNSKYFEVIG